MHPSSGCQKRTCTFASGATHTLQCVQSISIERARAFPSACGAYVEADIWIDQRFLRCCDAFDAQGGLEWRTSLDQP